MPEEQVDHMHRRAGNGDGIELTGIKIGGALVRKLLLGGALFTSSGGGVYTFVKMHNEEMADLKGRMHTMEEQMGDVNRGQIALLKHFGIKRPAK